MENHSEIDFDRTIIEDRKITDYLMNEEHPRGKNKAIVFMSRGFSKERVVEFKNRLVQHAKENKIILREETIFGAMYIIEGKINAPEGRVLNIRSVWIVENRQNFPKFVTAYPI